MTIRPGMSQADLVRLSLQTCPDKPAPTMPFTSGFDRA